MDSRCSECGRDVCKCHVLLRLGYDVNIFIKVQKFLRQTTKAGLMFCIELDDALKYEPDEKEVLLRIGDVLWRYLYNETKDRDEQIETIAK